LIICGAILSIIGLSEFLFGQYFFYNFIVKSIKGYIYGTSVTLAVEDIMRIKSSFHSPNAFAAYLNIFTPFLIATIFFAKSKGKIFFSLGILFIYLFGILSSVSRGAFLSLAIIFLLVLFTAMKKKLITVLILLPFLILFLSLEITQIMIDRFELMTSGNDLSSLLRLAFWHTAWEIIKSNPILGTGFYNFQATYPLYVSPKLPDMIREMSPYHAHNIFLQMGSGVGLIGLLLFIGHLWSVLLVLIYFFKTASTENHKILFLGSIGAWANVIVHGQVGYAWSHYANGTVFWIIIGMCISTYLRHYYKPPGRFKIKNLSFSLMLSDKG
jgi:O-antigen ligase